MTVMDEQETYLMNTRDRHLIGSAAKFLDKLMQAPWVRPAERVTIAKLLHVLSKLPQTTELDRINLSLSTPRKWFDEIETYHWLEIDYVECQLTIQNGGHFYRKSTGGDTFTATSWFISPGDESSYNDYMASLWMVPDAATFQELAERINLSESGYSLTLIDEANTLLEEMEDDESEEDYECEDDASEEEENDDSENEFEPFELLPVDDDERELAKLVFTDEVAAHETEYGSGAKNCDHCGQDLSKRGFYVDGKLRGQIMWANLCIPCWRRYGEGIGWGAGQLYARQPNGDFRLVAGFAP